MQIKCFTDYGIFTRMALTQYTFASLVLQLHQFIGGTYAYIACLLVWNIFHISPPTTMAKVNKAGFRR